MAAAWLTLFDAAMAIIDEAERLTGAKIEWSIGGGTMLHRAYRHRHSKDIDIFLGDPQLLASLSPRLNDVAARCTEGSGGSYVEQSSFLKITLADGEIDFIVAPRLTTPPATMSSIGGRAAMVETPAEILAKKVLYRAADFTARDVFDLAFLIEQGEADKLLDDRRAFMPKFEAILRRIETSADGLRRAFGAIDADEYAPSFDHCVAVIRDFVERHRWVAG